MVTLRSLRDHDDPGDSHFLLAVLEETKLHNQPSPFPGQAWLVNQPRTQVINAQIKIGVHKCHGLKLIAWGRTEVPLILFIN